jgi:hypothetical protein
MKFNKKVAKAVAGAVVAVLLALGVANADKIGAVLDALTAFAPDESAEPAPVGDVPAADAGL